MRRRENARKKEQHETKKAELTVLSLFGMKRNNKKKEKVKNITLSAYIFVF
jgi:hypothetical protein